MSQFTHLSEDKEIVEQAEVIQKQVDEIFELARTNNWELEQFAKKILAGAAENDLGYFAIAAQLVQHVTNLKGIKAIRPLAKKIYVIIRSFKFSPLELTHNCKLLTTNYNADHNGDGDSDNDSTIF